MLTREEGFSLVELMVVVAIIAILAAVAMPAYFNHMMRSRQSRAINELMAIQAAEERYFVENGTYANEIGLLPEYASAGTSPGAFYNAPGGIYRYRITPLGTIRAEGDLDGDGNFGDVWELPQGDLGAKPKNTATEKVNFLSFLGRLFK